MFRRRRRRFIRTLLILLLVLAAFLFSRGHFPGKWTEFYGHAASSFSEYSKDADYEVHFLDVGQADCALIKFSDSAVLIDGGNDADAGYIKKYLKNEGIESLDLVVGTHPHEDHIGGLDDIINQFTVKKIVLPKCSSDTKTFEDLLDSISKKGLKITEAYSGVDLSLDGARLTVLSPPRGANYDDLNEYSAVIKLEKDGVSFLFTGDAQSVNEEEMQSSDVDLKSTVLKVGHHGSDTSTTEKFLEAVSPEYAVISVGAGNPYGHPAETTIKRLQDAHVRTYRTDEDKTVVFYISKEGEIKVQDGVK